MKVTATRNTCIGAAQCSQSAPNVFTQDDDEGLVEILDADPPEAEWENVRQAENLCPSASIHLKDDAK